MTDRNSISISDREMENLNISETTVPNIVSISSPFELKNIAIGFLVILLSLSFLGINLLDTLSSVVKYLGGIFGPLIARILTTISHTTGYTLNASADVISDTSKAGIDIAEGTVQSLGDLLISVGSGGDVEREVSKEVDRSRDVPVDPTPDSSSAPIQNSVSKGKTKWCLVGDYNNKRGCVSVSDSAKCMSGDIFPTQEMCLNPNLITNVLPDKQNVLVT
jgi:hypothetical protein